MRVLIFCDNHPRSASFIFQDYQAVSKRADVRFIHTQPAENDDPNIIQIPFNLYSTRAKIAWKMEQWQLGVKHYDPDFRREFNKFLKEFKPDVIHAQFAYEGIKLWDCIDNRDQYRFLFSFRGYDSTYKLRNSAYRKKMASILASPNVYAHFVCAYLRNNLNKHDVATPRPRVIYTGIDVDHYSPSEGDGAKNGKVFLQVGGFNDKKGHSITIEVFKQFLDRTGRDEVTMRFVGDGKNFDACKKQVADLGLTDKVIFLGRQGKPEIKEELKNASCFVHHSVTGPNGDQEGIPNAVAEAMAMNLPVITSVHAGITELVLPEADGVMIEEGDIPNYVDAMEKYIDAPRSTTNRKLVEAKFTLQEHVGGFLKYYEEIGNS